MADIRIPKEKLEEIAEQYGIADVYIFGSQATGFVHEGSDIDIAVRFAKGLPGLKERGRLYGELYADLFPYFSDPKLDLVFFQEAPLHIQFKIVAEGVLLYSKNPAQAAETQEHVANLYRDYHYFIDEYMRGLRAAPISS
ncbi:MAG TPA: nucleotidyltransferase domain-containing protein [Candidatus Paceibacterota bacterium]